MEKWKLTDGYYVQIYRNKYGKLKAMDNFLVKIPTLQVIILRIMSRSVIIDTGE